MYKWNVWQSHKDQERGTGSTPLWFSYMWNRNGKIVDKIKETNKWLFDNINALINLWSDYEKKRAKTIISIRNERWFNYWLYRY